MITSPGSGVILSETDSKNIEAVKIVISNLNTEVSLQRKNITILQGEIEKLIKEKEYLSENAQLLDTEVSYLLKEKEDLLAFSLSRKEELEKLNDELHKKELSLHDSLRLADERLKSITEKEGYLKQRLEEVRNKEAKLSEEEALVVIAKSAFEEAVKTVVWK